MSVNIKQELYFNGELILQDVRVRPGTNIRCLEFLSRAAMYKYSEDPDKNDVIHNLADKAAYRIPIYGRINEITKTDECGNTIKYIEIREE